MTLLNALPLANISLVLGLSILFVVATVRNKKRRSTLLEILGTGLVCVFLGIMGGIFTGFDLYQIVFLHRIIGFGLLYVFGVACIASFVFLSILRVFGIWKP